MKKPALFSLLSFSSLLCFSQFSVTGKVIDAETKEPLLGASVFALNTTRGTVTNADGGFILSLDKGGYDISFSFTGYNSKTISVHGGNEPLIIELSKVQKRHGRSNHYQQ